MINEIQVTPDMFVSENMNFTMHNPLYFENPEKFDITRHLNKEES